MRILIAALALAGALAAACAPAQAWIAQKGGAAVTPTTQIFISNTTANPSTAAVRYMPVMFSISPATAETGAMNLAPFTGTISSIRVKALTAVTAGTWVIKLRKNGVDTALTCTIISSTPNSMCTSTGTVSFAAGDNLTWSTNPSSASLTRFSMATIMQPSTANDTVIATDGTAVTTTTQVMGPFLSSVASSAANRRNNTMPDGGTVDLLYVASNAPGTAGSGKSWAHTVDKGASTTALTCTIADDATTCSDLSHSFSVTGPSGSTPGDDLQFQMVGTGTPALAVMAASARYRPTTAGRFVLMANTNTTLDAANTLYCPLVAGINACSTTEANETSVTEAFTAETISAKVVTAPGSGKSYVFTLRKNGSDTAMTCTIADTATGCTATGSISFAAGDLGTTSIVPSGTPATSLPGISYLAH